MSRYRDRDRTPRTESTVQPIAAASSDVVVLAEREITLDAFIRVKGDLGRAFATTLLLESGGKAVKLTRAAWDEKFKAWREKPRGGGK